MNQSIQFPELEVWDPIRLAVCFPVLINGMKFTCAVGQASLSRRFGGNSPEQWLVAFQHARWDLEDEAEMLINEDAVDDQGWLWLS